MRSNLLQRWRGKSSRLLPPGGGLIPFLLLIQTCPFPTMFDSPVAKVTVVADNPSLVVGSETQVTATVTDAAGNVLTDRSVTWSSSNTYVAAALASSPTTALVSASAAGSATISATTDGISGGAGISVTSSDTTPSDTTGSGLAKVTVTLTSTSLLVGSLTGATATLTDSNGNVLSGLSVSWASSNTSVATVLATGPTTASVTAVAGGTATITATSDGKVGGADLAVTSGTSDGSHPNEPAGFTRAAEHTFEAKPGAGPPRLCSGLGLLDGCWFVYDPSGNYSTVLVADAPASAPGVLQVRYRTGLAPGSGIGPVQAGDGSSDSNSRDYSALYESSWVRVPTPDFEFQWVGVKFLGYVGVAQKGQGGVPNQVYFVSDCGGCGDATIKPDANIRVVQQAPISRSLGQNVATGRLFTFGQWHHIEYLMTLNDLGQANGTLKVWIDGTLTHHYTDVAWRNSSNPSGFYARHWDPVWGGTGGSSKSRDDFLQIDHLYLSGILCPAVCRSGIQPRE